MCIRDRAQADHRQHDQRGDQRAEHQGDHDGDEHQGGEFEQRQPLGQVVDLSHLRGQPGDLGLPAALATRLSA